MAVFTCEICEKVFTRKSSLTRHISTMHNDGVICEICGLRFRDITKLNNHFKVFHPQNEKQSKNVSFLECQSKEGNNKLNISARDLLEAGVPSSSNSLTKLCDVCKTEVNLKDWKYHLRTNLHKLNSAQPIDDYLKVVKSAFRERIETIIYENKDEGLLDPSQFFLSAKSSISKAIITLLEKHESIKFNMELFCEFIKMTKSNDPEDTDYDIVVSIKSFNSKMSVLNNKEELPNIFKDMEDKIETKMGEFQERDSGWSLIRICYVEVNINQYKPLRGSQYLPLPKFILKKKACVNVQNSDEYCFKWAIISALYAVKKDADRIRSYQVQDISAKTVILKNGVKLEFGELKFPLNVSDITCFEQMNPEISINVFGYEEIGNSIVRRKRKTSI